jgi:hypothetical protein
MRKREHFHRVFAFALVYKQADALQRPQLHDFVADGLQQGNGLVKDRPAGARGAEQRLVHGVQRDILKAEQLGSVMVCDHHTVHIPNPDLEAARGISFRDRQRLQRHAPILEECRADEIEVFSLEALVQSVLLRNLVARVLLIVHLVHPDRQRRTRLDVEHSRPW